MSLRTFADPFASPEEALADTLATADSEENAPVLPPYFERFKDPAYRAAFNAPLPEAFIEKLPPEIQAFERAGVSRCPVCGRTDGDHDEATHDACEASGCDP